MASNCFYNTLLQARRPIREVAANHLRAHLETWLHTVGSRALMRHTLEPREPIDRQIFVSVVEVVKGPMRERDMLRAVQYLYRHPFDDMPPVAFLATW